MIPILVVIFAAEVSNFTPSGVNPDLFLIAVAAFVVLGKKDALYFSATCGLLKDITCSGPLGFHVLLYVLLALLLTKARQILFLDNILFFPVLIFVLTALSSTLSGILVGAGYEKILHIAVVNSIYSTWIALFVFVVVKLCMIAGYKLQS